MPKFIIIIFLDLINGVLHIFNYLLNILLNHLKKFK
jgi:hypothetical protein